MEHFYPQGPGREAVRRVLEERGPPSLQGDRHGLEPSVGMCRSSEERGPPSLQGLGVCPLEFGPGVSFLTKDYRRFSCSPDGPPILQGAGRPIKPPDFSPDGLWRPDHFHVPVRMDSRRKDPANLYRLCGSALGTDAVLSPQSPDPRSRLPHQSPDPPVLRGGEPQDEARVQCFSPRSPQDHHKKVHRLINRNSHPPPFLQGNMICMEDLRGRYFSPRSPEVLPNQHSDIKRCNTDDVGPPVLHGTETRSQNFRQRFSETQHNRNRIPEDAGPPDLQGDNRPDDEARSRYVPIPESHAVKFNHRCDEDAPSDNGPSQQSEEVPEQDTNCKHNSDEPADNKAERRPTEEASTQGFNPTTQENLQEDHSTKQCTLNPDDSEPPVLQKDNNQPADEAATSGSHSSDFSTSLPDNKADVGPPLLQGDGHKEPSNTSGPSDTALPNGPPHLDNDMEEEPDNSDLTLQDGGSIDALAEIDGIKTGPNSPEVHKTESLKPENKRKPTVQQQQQVLPKLHIQPARPTGKRRRHTPKDLMPYRRKRPRRRAPPQLSPVPASMEDSEQRGPPLLGEPCAPSAKKRRARPFTTSHQPSVKRGANGWEDSLRPRPSTVRHFTQTSHVAVEQPREKDQEATPADQSLEAGSVVWGKLGGTRWWPGLIIQGQECGQPEPRQGYCLVFWTGDHKISEVPTDRMVDFIKDYSSHSNEPGSSKVFKKAILEAIKEVADRVNAPKLQSDEPSDLLAWAAAGFPTSNGPPVLRKEMSSPVLQHLARIKSQLLQPPISGRVSRLEAALEKVRQGTIALTEVCISCGTDQPACQHPLVEGGLCTSCRNEVASTMFAYDDDGTNAYCALCGQAGELLICDNPECNRCYCLDCVRLLVGPQAHVQALSTSPWTCYLCKSYTEETHGLLQPKASWQQNILEMFRPASVPKSTVVPSGNPRPIRVLSLFDGIATGRLVLDQLGLDVEVYFSSEVDQDAVSVALAQQGAKVTLLGNVEELQDTKVSELCPIDLVIGGSPCNDLTLVNPGRKGLFDANGTGRLFFEFFRVLRAVQMASQGHVFWLYENVASMPHEYKTIISRFLQAEPVLMDSKYFSPQNRARYFWGNIPGMCIPLPSHLLDQNIKLESMLIPHLNRKATVDKIRTVSHSLPQGSVLPVEMNGEADNLWVTELEQVFGFPKHYTDAGNVPLDRRVQLLGRAWSVPVIKHLLAPLRNFFKTI